VWTPQFDYTTATVSLTAPTATTLTWSNRNNVDRYASTDIVGRRAFRRSKILPVSNPLPAVRVAANAIADAWLPGHKTTPFRGSVTVTGSRAVREVRTGIPVPPELMLIRTMELLRFTDRGDPTTGAWGRDGRIVAVTYTADTDQAQATVDNTRQDFEALMARLNLLSGGT